MSEEEQQEGGMSTLKKTIIGVLTTAITGAGVYVTTNINKVFGIEEEEEKTEQVQPAPAAQPLILNIDNSSQNNSSNSGGGGTTVIKETVREVQAQPQQSAPVVEEKPETPAERMKRLKAEKAKQDGGGE
jgi:hypothetical protein